MPASLAHEPLPSMRVRTAGRRDLDALMTLEHRVFATDRLSRRSLRRFLQSPSAALIVAEAERDLAGTAIVLFRPRSALARLYSIAVAPHFTGRGVGALLLGAAAPSAWRSTTPTTPPSRAIARAATRSSTAVPPTTRTAAMPCGSRSGWSPTGPGSRQAVEAGNSAPGRRRDIPSHLTRAGESDLCSHPIPEAWPTCLFRANKGPAWTPLVLSFGCY
jgi:GNAT superfamily N-acetyltransferase